MATTQVTCGQLRLSVPNSACIPKLNLLDSQSVQITFSNFSGTVLFEALPRHSAPSSVPDPPNPSSLTSLISAPLLASQSPFPCSQPAQGFADTHLASRVPPVPHFSHEYLRLTPGSTPSPSPPRSPLPFSQSLLPQTQFPANLPDDNPAPSSTQPTLSAHDAALASQFDVQQSQAEAEKTHPSKESPETDIVSKSVKKQKAQNQNGTGASKKSHQSHKKPVLPIAKVEHRRGGKQGKRVRFEDQPVVLSSPVKKPPPLNVFTPWHTLKVADGNVPQRRWGATLSHLNDNNYLLLGGESEMSGFFDQMAMYKSGESRWILSGHDVPSMPEGGRAWHTTNVVESSLIIFGGEKSVDGERVQTNDTLIYDPSYFSWYPPSYYGGKPSPRAGHCAAVIPNTRNLAVYGGINGNKWLNDLFVLEELCTWKKIRLSARSARPSARSYASLTPASGFLVLFGGNNKTKCFNDVHFLATDSFVWTEVTIPGGSPKPRTGHCAVPSKDGKNVVVYGGWDDQGLQRIFFSDVWELRIKSATECQWICLFRGDQKSRTPGPRAGASMCTSHDDDCDAVMYGGWHQFSYFDDLTKLSLTKKKTTRE